MQVKVVEKAPGKMTIEFIATSAVENMVLTTIAANAESSVSFTLQSGDPATFTSEKVLVGAFWLDISPLMSRTPPVQSATPGQSAQSPYPPPPPAKSSK